MKRIQQLLLAGCLQLGISLCVLLCCSTSALSQEEEAPGFDFEIENFLEQTCLDCHDSDSESTFDLTSIERDLSSDNPLQRWVRVYDRVASGEMPPADGLQPSHEARQEFLTSFKADLLAANQAQQETLGRVPSRRLTRQEYEYTLHDLLGIGGDLAKQIPPENSAASFDVVAEAQAMSSVHIRGFMRAADLALKEAIRLDPKPEMSVREIDYLNSPYIQMWVDRPVRRGGGTVFKTDQDVITFRGENFVFRSDANGFRPQVAGIYRLEVTAAAYQQRSSITVSLKRQNDRQGESELFAAWDLSGEEFRTVSTTHYLRPDDYIYISADELEPAPNGEVIYGARDASKFKGEGVRIRKVTVEGPLEESWPPMRTQSLLTGIELQKEKEWPHFYQPILEQAPQVHLREILSNLAKRAYGRPLSEAEIESLLELAKPALEDERGFIEAARIPLQSLLISPNLLFQTGPAGPLSDHDLARRLSYFLWRSLPDRELQELAEQGKLSQPEVLAEQVDRLLADPKSERFVEDFLGQWLELHQIDATTPDSALYPEYDDVLRRAMLAETHEFFAYLIEADLDVSNLIDSDFTFLNRKLAEHYQIDGVEGELMRKVSLTPDQVRGGILTQAAIAKITANGTVTTPVKRGNFVLTNLLGLPPNPPPPGIGSIEPDTRGATTIRETLEKHQAIESCAACHRHIDPPGFALECFDPVGNFRTQYRNSKGVRRDATNGLRFLHVDYQLGSPVDTSGTTADGKSFKAFQDYQSHLLESSDQVARNLLSKLIVFGTGGEIEFADREEIEAILEATKAEGYPIRTLIHQVVASRLFRNR